MSMTSIALLIALALALLLWLAVGCQNAFWEAFLTGETTRPPLSLYSGIVRDARTGEPGPTSSPAPGPHARIAEYRWVVAA